MCSEPRCFDTFFKLFQHITVFHQKEPFFSISCDLYDSCGALYRTYAAYKAHIYRYHYFELHPMGNSDTNNQGDGCDNVQHTDNIPVENKFALINSDDDDDTEIPFMNDDETGFHQLLSSLKLTDGEERSSETPVDIQRLYLSFILQLREQYLLPGSVTNIISTFITTMIQQLPILLETKTFICSEDNNNSTTSAVDESKKVLRFDQLKQKIDQMCGSIECITKNEYQFRKSCENYFGFNPPQEIVLSSPNQSLTEHGYFIPIDETIKSMLNSQSLLLEVLRNIQEQRNATEDNPDLMFSIRDGYYGRRLDQDDLLIQLYTDDIGLTNPIGSKRNQHKMCMIYFTLEDIPEQYRSKLDFIQLVGICESKILKVIHLMEFSGLVKSDFRMRILIEFETKW